jgi:WD40 repeat protein
VPGKPEESLLFLLANREKRPVMPPRKEDALAPDQVAILRAWIEGGAMPGEAPVAAVPPDRALPPPSYPRAPAVTALAYSSDGRLLLVAGYREVLVHDVESAAGSDRDQGTAPRERLVGEAERLNALSMSPAGLWLAAAGGSPGLFGEVQIWDTATWELEHFVRMGKDTLFAVAFSHDGSRVAAAGVDRTVRVVDAMTGAELFAAEVHSDWVTGIAFTGDGERVVSAGRDRTIKSSDVTGGRAVDTVATWNEPVLTLASRPGSNVVLAAGEGKTPVLLDALEGKELRKLEAQSGAVLASAFSRDGNLVAVAAVGDDVRVYGADDGDLKAVLRGMKDWVYAIAFSPDGERIAVAGYEGVVRIYDVNEEKEVRGFVPVVVRTAESK